jgi:hypothetical protein
MFRRHDRPRLIDRSVAVDVCGGDGNFAGGELDRHVSGRIEVRHRRLHAPVDNQAAGLVGFGAEPRHDRDEERLHKEGIVGR